MCMTIGAQKSFVVVMCASQPNSTGLVLSPWFVIVSIEDDRKWDAVIRYVDVGVVEISAVTPEIGLGIRPRL